MRYLLRLLLVFVLLALCPSFAHAQTSDWRERRTERFVILYSAGDATTADQYAGFVDSIYDEIAAIFGHRTSTPVTLRLYPSLESYYEVNPLARGMQGVIAHADFRRHELVVIVPQTSEQTPDEVQNNVRHELTHLVAAELSENRLNVGFQEGVAQYVEHPSGELEAKIQLLQRALDRDQLLPWSALDDRDIIYQHSNISYPQSLSIVAFLIERFSFAKMREFLSISARSSGYRSALERAFGQTPDQLEREWREWLPEYVSGGYRRNTLTAYDLSQAELLLQQGRYSEAQHELEIAIDWLRTANQAEVLALAELLLEQSLDGQRAEALTREARTELERGSYAQVMELVEQARVIYRQLGDTRQDAVLSAYAERATRGMRAAEALAEAAALVQSFRYPQARGLIDRAVADYIALGDRSRADQALSLRALLDQRQSLLGAILLFLGIGGIAVSSFRRLTVREQEAW